MPKAECGQACADDSIKLADQIWPHAKTGELLRHRVWHCRAHNRAWHTAHAIETPPRTSRLEQPWG